MTKNDKSYYKAAHSIITQDRGTLGYDDYEYEDLLKPVKEAPILRSIVEFDLAKEKTQVHTLTTEVLKACNVIRPSHSELK